MTQKTYIAYYRTSKDSHKSGRSISRGLGLDAQHQIVEHFYKDSITHSFTEVKSAKNITDRPELQKAIQLCLSTNSWLAVAKLDRLSRNVDDIRLIHKQMAGKIQFCDIPSENEPDLFTITLFAAFAERERTLISLRTSQALQSKLKREGKWQKGNPIFTSGIANSLSISANKLKAKLNENSIRASQLISLKRSEGLSYLQIANTLNQHKFLSPNGNLFFPASVRRLFLASKNI
jgi:DNA invertase Pin-like site-specific DNA recombinase